VTLADSGTTKITTDPATADLDCFESVSGVVAGLVPASPNIGAQSENSRGDRDKPGHDPEEMGIRSGRTQTASAITIYVCITCRGGRPLDLVPVPGEVLATATARAAEGTGIAVRPIRCLANCNRGLSAAVRRDGAWTYVFGHLDLLTGASALIEGAKLFANTPDGLMPWRGRPDALKRGLVARTPPFDFAGES
jgi:predicted metal-binding protein